MKDVHFIILRLLKAWWPFMLWATLIYWGSTDEVGGEKSTGVVRNFLLANFHALDWRQVADSIYFIRKCCHVSEYLILSMLFLRGLTTTSFAKNAKIVRCLWSWKMAALTFFVCVGYAASDEWHQSFTTQRCGSPIDVLIDSFGVILGIGFVFVIYRLRPFSSDSVEKG